MNERIKELAKQATEYETGICMFGEFKSKKKFNKQKFAELIVKECANIARQTESDDSDDYKSGRTWASLDILEHFGV